MNRMKIVLVLALCASGYAGLGADGYWTNNRSGNWSVAGNWSNSVIADGAGATAFLRCDITFIRTVTNDVARPIGNLELSDGGLNGQTWIVGGGSSLTFSGGSTSEVRWLTPVEIVAPLAGSADMLFAGSSAGFWAMPVLALKGTNTFSGISVLRRGGLSAWGNSPAGANGVMGNSTNAIQVGDAGTLVSDNLQFCMDGDASVFARPVVVNNYGNTVVIGNLANGGIVNMLWSGDVMLNRSVLLAGHAGVMRMSGKITGTGGITKSDSSPNNGTVILQGNNDFSGDVAISRGTLLVAHSNALGSAITPIQLGDTNTTTGDVWLRITNGITLNREILVTSNGTGVAGFGSGYFNTTGTVARKVTLQRTLTTESSTGSRLFFPGLMEGPGGIIVGGNVLGETYLYCPSNTFNGDVLVRHGFLNVTNVVRKGQDGPLGNSSGAIVLGAAAADSPTLYVDANGEVDRDFRVQWAAATAKIGTRTATNLVFSGNLAIVSNPVTVISPDNATNLIEWTGSFSGTGRVQKSGAGVLVLSGNNSAYAGGINLADGTLRLNSPSPIGNGRFQFSAYGTRLENSYGPYTFTNAVGFGRPVGYYSTPDVVFLGEKKVTGNITDFSILVDQTNTLLGFPGDLVSFDIGGLTKSGSGILDWGGTNLTATFTNLISINAGVLRTCDGISISTQSTIRFFGGVWESTGTCTRALGTGVGSGQIYWGGNGGFSAFGAPFAVDLAGAASNLCWWGSNNFVSAVLQFGSVRSDNAVYFKDRIDLNGASRTIGVYDNPASISDKAVLEGGIQGSTSHGITKLYPGVLALGATNTYLGATTVNEGTLLVDGELDYSATAVVQCKTNTWLGGRGTVKRKVTLDPGFAGFDWADAPGTLTVTTNVALPRGFTYNFRRLGGQVPLVNVTGTLTASNSVTVNVFGDTRTPLVLFSAGALAGTQNLTNWVVTGSSKDYTVKVQGTAIVATCPSAGTIITIK